MFVKWSEIDRCLTVILYIGSGNETRQVRVTWIFSRVSVPIIMLLLSWRRDAVDVATHLCSISKSCFLFTELKQHSAVLLMCRQTLFFCCVVMLLYRYVETELQYI